MKRCQLLTLLIVVGLLFILPAAAFASPAVQAGAPTVVSYQGQVVVSGTPYSGTGYFKFAIVNPAGTVTYWSNNGTSTAGGQPSAAVPLIVNAGLFSVLLGDTAQTNMSQPLSASAFSGTDRLLRVWFSTNNVTFTQLAPDRRLASVPYALQAEKAKQVAKVIVVAQSGGDFTSIQAALDSITDATERNRYLVWVAPGEYNERVTMIPYVDIEGAGELSTKIRSEASNDPFTGTVTVASNAELRFLTVENTGGDGAAVAIYGDNVSLRLTHVTAIAADGSEKSIGVYCQHCTASRMTNATVSAANSMGYSAAIEVSYTTLVMTDVTASAKGLEYNVHNMGIVSACSLVTVQNSIVSASGGENSINMGLMHVPCSGDVLTVTNSSATASGGAGSFNRALNVSLSNGPSSAIIRSSVLSAFGGMENAGAYLLDMQTPGGSYTLTINNSQIIGSSFTIHNDTHVNTRVGASQLDGGPVYKPTGGTVTCAGVYDEDYAFYASTCP